MKNLYLFILVMFFSRFVAANNAHSTLNIFSPNNDQTNFTLIENSKTTDAKYFNTVAFFDMAFESLALYGSPAIEASDTMSFVHLGISYGLNKRLEIGGRFPFLVNQGLDSAQVGSSLELTGTGFTNVIGFLKYRLIDKESFGAAILAQVGLSNSEENFYLGESSGPNFSLSFILEKAFGKWSTALNLGYISRSPGDRGPTYSFFEPIDSTINASIGISRALSEKSSLGLELLMNQHDFDIDSSDREKMAMEAFLAYRTQYKKLRFIFGGGFGLNGGVSEPAYRGFAGVNYKFTFRRQKVDKPEEDIVEVDPGDVEPVREETVDVESDPVEATPIEETVEVEEESVAPTVIEQTITIDEEDEVSAVLEKFDQANKGVKAEYQKIIISYIEFEFNSYTLNAKSKETLDEVVKYLENADFEKLEVIGHTDFYGTTMYNELLSLRRAKSVTDYFILKGIPKNKLRFNGYGKRRPLDTGVSEKARQRNRRVELVLRNKVN